MTAAQQLAAWVAREQLSLNMAARRIGVDWGSLRNWISGSQRPGLDAAVRLESETGIPVAAWARETKPKASPKRAKRAA